VVKMIYEDGGDIKYDGRSEVINGNGGCSEYRPEGVICIVFPCDSNGVVGFGFGWCCS